jgi:hypothetical protein
MGGGGGGYSISSGDLDDLRRQVEERTRQSLVDSEVNAMLGDELARITARDIPRTSAYLDEIAEALADDVAAFDKLLFGGSVAKHTYVDGLSDIDSLVVLKGDQLQDLSPQQLRERFCEALEKRLGGEVIDVRSGNLAVTVTYRDGTEIQLLPARASGDAVEISSSDGTRWNRIEPRRFAETLTNVNQAQRGAVVPTIKLAKSIIARLPDRANLSGYHVEALAVAAFTGYTGPRTPKEMLTHFFRQAAAAVQRPVSDTTGQSKNIDDSLGPARSEQRLSVSRQLRLIAQRMENSESADDWRKLLGS